MFRKSKLVAATLVAAASLAASAPAHANHGTGSSPVVGYIYIQQIGAQLTPSYTLYGALANPALWTCAGGMVGVGYEVTCSPSSSLVNLAWHCDVLHADITLLSAQAAGHTSLDCNGDANYEAQTVYLNGGPNYDFVWAASPIAVSKFTCRVDAKKNGVVVPAVKDFRGGCGDPGIVRFDTH